MTEARAIRIATLYDDLEKNLRSLKTDRERVRASRAHVERRLTDGAAYYGINTGFGALASKRIDPSSLEALQHNLLVSHAVGLGSPVPREIARLMLGLKAFSLSLGFSGISEPVFDRLVTLFELDLIPLVPQKGSLGASGDLAPLAHLSLPLIGLGSFLDADGKTHTASSVLQAQGLKPVALAAKDGLALINGTQLMSAYGAYVMHRSLALIKNADLLASLSLEALRGSLSPFDARIHAVRPHKGQRDVAANVRLLMTDSQILDSHKDCGRVQDPYSLRCVPQVHGAARDALAYACEVIEVELNSVTDNPLVFEDGSIISGGNFHGEPLALAMDFAAIALAELASISERRTYLLLTGHDGLPTLLMKDTGLNSGFMIPQYTAAALVSQNKILCHPASVDSIPTCLGQEDHVSMGSLSALKLLEVLENTEKVLAIEALTAAQALDYRAPLQPGKGVAAVHGRLREAVAHKEADAYFGDDIERALTLLRELGLVTAAETAVGQLA